MKMVLESLASSNDEKVTHSVTPTRMRRGSNKRCLPQEQRIKELEASLKCQNVQQKVKGYNHSSERIITSVFL